jgi:hypothetical protein
MKPTVFAYGDGRYVPNPAHYGFSWPEVQAAGFASEVAEGAPRKADGTLQRG